LRLAQIFQNYNRLKILENWKLFASKLVDLLQDIPIQFPDTFKDDPKDKAKVIYDSVLAKAKAAGNQEKMSIIGFEFLKERKIFMA